MYVSPPYPTPTNRIAGRRSGQTCPGYPDASKLRVRDETTRVIDRARRAPRKTGASSRSPLSTQSAASTDSDDASVSTSTQDGGDETISDVDSQALLMLLDPAAPAENLHDLGINYYLSNYVVANSGPCPGFLNYSWDIITDSGGDCEMVQVAIRAIGLAALASATGTEKLNLQARASYSQALRRLNTVLVDKTMANHDSTVFTILTLSLYETITCSDVGSLEAWKNHINGAINLLMQRGAAQFRTTQGQQIFGEAVAHLLTLCSRVNQPVPPKLRALRVEWQRTTEGTSPAWMLATTHIEVMELFHRVNPDKDTPFLQDEWETLLARGVELDQRIQILVKEIPAPWGFKTVHDPEADPRVVYRGVYHIYYNTWVGKIWDGIRACRIFANQAIYCLLLREGFTWAPEVLSEDGLYLDLLQRASDTTTQMRDDILASVPQMLGFVRQDEATGTWYLDSSSPDIPHLAPANGGYFLLWHLFLAGTLWMNAPDVRLWAIDRLRAIRSATGIQKAGFLADALKFHPGLVSSLLLANEYLVRDL
ncbi:hypothetical protein BO71DRAFT_393785 [Aspergillus ellipticus CBS 707.79]|uniref:Zn(II)2Cys6 transcription factor n=1 Tax=Aspergillus ellipticus CBS 707.79 TaxID=1448320 RepID=A0A319DRA5_9EURO|nr:hypothetical protein BO71DRAFT_393785 [Aspergillus ellipticus CBS 707.79]